MPKVSRESATGGGDYGAVLDRSEDVEGYTINFVSFRQDIDATPLYKGLPDDRCQCPHWGYVVSGRLTMRFADREETYVAGDAYYVPAGHTPVVTSGTEVIEFSPTAALNETMAVLGANMQAHVHA